MFCFPTCPVYALVRAPSAGATIFFRRRSRGNTSSAESPATTTVGRRVMPVRKSRGKASPAHSPRNWSENIRDSATFSAACEACATVSEKLPCREDLLRDRRRNGEYRFIYNLAQPQIHRHAAKQVSVNRAESPAIGEQIDHARGGRASGAGSIARRFDDNPLAAS